MVESQSPEQDLFDSVKEKNIHRLIRILRDKPDLDLNCSDKDELTPLQQACHSGETDIVTLLINNGADVNYTKRKDGYTALMFAAISNKHKIVRLLLERGADITIENCVNRTASQMAAFIGLYKISQIISCWVPYEKSVEPYTRKRELENAPRIPSPNLGRLLHEFIVLPSLHPVKFFIFLKENLQLIKYGAHFKYVLENLCSKAAKPPNIDETLSLKYHYLSFILEYSLNQYKTSKPVGEDVDAFFDEAACTNALDVIIRRIVRRKEPNNVQPKTPQLDRFILECTMKFPYTHLGIFKTMTFAMNKVTSHYLILVQSLNWPHVFGHMGPETCSLCNETGDCKKCSKCKEVYYCGQQCQLADWFQHKKFCKSPN